MWVVVDAVGSSIAALATVGAVLIGIGAFRRQQQELSVAALREIIQNIRLDLEAVDSQLNDTNYLEIAHGITRSLRSHYDGEPDGASFLRWIKEMPDEMATAIITLGAGGNQIHADVELKLRTASARVAALEMGFPVIAHILRQTVILASKGALLLVTAHTYRQLFIKSREGLDNFGGEYLDKATNMIQAETMFAYSLSSLTSGMTAFREQRDFDAMETVVEILSDWVRNASDSELKRLLRSSALTSRRLSKKSKDAPTGTHTGEIRLGAAVLTPFCGKSVRKRIEEQCKIFESEPDLVDSLKRVPREQLILQLEELVSSGEEIQPQMRAALESLGIRVPPRS